MKMSLYILKRVSCTFLLFSILLSDRYFIDTENSKVVWIGRKVSGQHHGIIDINNGYIDIEDNSIVGGEIVIDMTSIKVLDMTDKYNKKLEDHLKHSDFFDVNNFPEATFKIKKSYDFLMIDNILFEGDLKIKDKTVNSFMPTGVSIDGYIAEAIGIVDIDRTLFGITYGSGTFFEDLADRAIDDNFTLKFKIIASSHYLDNPLLEIDREDGK